MYFAVDGGGGDFVSGEFVRERVCTNRGGGEGRVCLGARLSGDARL